MFKKLSINLSLKKTGLIISVLSVGVFAWARPQVFENLFMDRDFIKVEVNHSDGQYNLNETATFRIISKRDVTDSKFRISLNAYLNGASVDLDTSSNQQIYMKLLNNYGDYVFTVQAFLEDAVRVDALKASQIKVERQINEIQDLINEGSSDVNLPAELARLKVLRSSFQTQLQKYRKFVQEKSVTVSVIDLRPRVSFLSNAETIDLSQNATGSIVVHLNKIASETITVPYTVSGTALGPNSPNPDHDLSNGTAIFQPGEESVTIPFHIVSGSQNWPKSLEVTLGNPNSGVVVSEPRTHVVTIVKSSSVMPPTIGSIKMSYDGSGSTNIVVLSVVNLKADPDRDVVKLEFDFGDQGPKVTESVAQYNIWGGIKHIYDVGTYTVKVFAIDDHGLKGPPTELSFTVSGGVGPIPKFSATVDQSDGRFMKFSAAGSKAQDGKTIKEYQWRITNLREYKSTSPELDVFFPGVAGTEYPVRLRVIDNENYRNQIFFTVRVESDNTVKIVGPVAVPIFNSMVGKAPFLAKFDASGSFDVNGEEIAAVYWDFNDQSSYDSVRPGVSTTHLFKRPGTYVIGTTVITRSGNRSTQYVPLFVVDDQKTAAKADIFAQRILSSNSVLFMSDQEVLSGVVDPNFMFWDFGDGSEVQTSRYTAHKFDLQGNASRTFNVSLSTIDMFGNQAKVVKPITIRSDDSYPQMSLGVPLTGMVNQVSNFRINYANDPLGLNLAFKWDFGDSSPQVVGNAVSHTYASNGAFCPLSIAENSEGRAVARRGQILVNSESSAPTARFVSTSYSGTAPFTVDLDATSSYTTNGSYIVDYYWNINDPNNFPLNFATGNRSQYTFENPGDYYIILLVKDSQGNMSTTFNSYTVQAPSVLRVSEVPTRKSFDRKGCHKVSKHTECYYLDQN